MSVTVYGCVNLPAGSITFENLETCLEQSSCLVMTGVHAGQVALTLSGADDEDCNDTFYGCWNPATGKFQVEIPTDCCVSGSPCSFCSPNPTPAFVFVIFNGITLCTDCCSDGGGFNTVFNYDINQGWRLPQVMENSCLWEIIITNFARKTFYYPTYPCVTPVGEYNYSLQIILQRAAGFLFLQAAIYYPPPYSDAGVLFFKEYESNSCVANANVLNGPGNSCYCRSMPTILGYGGYAVVSDSCADAPAWSAIVYYAIDNIVYEMGACYKCILGHINHPPPNPTYWEVI